MRDPALFNYVLLGLYVLNSGRWLVAGERVQSLYWVAAFLITLSVTLTSKGIR
jgi:hypothetical protein